MLTNFLDSFGNIGICGNNGIHTFRIFAEGFGNRVFNGTHSCSFQFTVNINANYGCIAKNDTVGVFNTFHLFGKCFEVDDPQQKGATDPPEY
ncbi:hypothetical protein G195_000446 [Phytophthora kernoviae 00238/432]|uniref:Uncharacterized protein n=1 Tax=Phytophthora kernoviae 00238/432 TaxID=1284355 RepID=A0A8J4SWD9_9STRA|nr:hypothetical protein G195_000446 [Phytophthora kernoviae 00238/432]